MANFITSPAPHVHGGDSVRKNMLLVIIALLPAYVISVVEFGWGALITAAISVAACVLTEWLIGRFVLKEKRQTIGDLSAVLTGLLLAFNLPSSIDWWIVLIGAVVAIGVGKMTFGGLGQNPFNPALVGRDGSRLIGSNTDVDGARFALERAGVEIAVGMKILVIGSGGVAMACCYLFTAEGADVTIIGRNQKTVQQLCKKFGCETTDRPDPSEYDMIVNCSPIGMYEEEKYPIDLTKIGKEQIIFDVVYTKETQLECVGRERGCTIVPGLDMLIGQGMRAFEVWTGQKPSYDSMRYSLVGDSGRMNIS